MKKCIILTLDTDYYEVTLDIAGIVNFIEAIKPLKKEYSSSSYAYAENLNGVDMSISFISNEKIRRLKKEKNK